ncbi:MAG: twin-arginine translocation signal domain-containing protein [Patulibacter sp.]|nr:twin-arginine translocation signal domain-containing protein [Patulibacter sp.]
MCDHHESTLDGGHRSLPHDHDHVSEATGTEGAGRGLTRRGALGAATVGGVALVFAGIKASPTGSLIDALGPDVAEAAATQCVMTPAKTVGPYFVDEKLNRSDVRANTSDGAVQAGVPLALTLHIFNADADCAPVSGATVDIWHANASGLYSDESANGTSGQNWLRGYQTTDSAGKVSFTTIWPGWYSGRAVHIHFKVRVYSGSTETLEFTSQMFFTDAMNKQVFANNSPYDQRSSTPDTLDSSDSILGSDAAVLTLSPTSDGSGGYTADFSVGVSSSTSQLNNTSAGAGGGGTGGGPGGTPPNGTPPGGAPTTTTTTSGGSTTTTTTNSATGSTTTSTSTADKAVAASLSAAAMVRSTLGTRQLKLTIKAQETVSVVATLTRSGKTIASKKGTLSSGTKTLKLAIPTSTSAGAAKLKLTLTDAARNTRSYARNVHVAKR